MSEFAFELLVQLVLHFVTWLFWAVIYGLAWIIERVLVTFWGRPTESPTPPAEPDP